ncbi:hypothetical protein AgCh_031434 [Apium graveolens]
MAATTIKVIVFVTTMSMALTVLLTMKHLSFDTKSSSDTIDVPSRESNDDEVLVMPFKRVNRFLAEEKNPRAADHCNKDNEYKYINVPVAVKRITNLTSNELSEAIWFYRERQVRALEKADQAEDSEGSGHSHRPGSLPLTGWGKERKKSPSEKA